MAIRFLFLLFPLIIGSSCVSVQQMHSATVLKEGESEEMISVSILDSSFLQYSDYPDNYITFAGHVSQRKGLGDNIDAGVYAYIPIMSDLKTGERYQPAPNLIGGDIKAQLIDTDNFDLALDVGLTMYSIATLMPANFGVIISSKKVYSSIFIHTHGIENMIFSTTLGYQGKHIVYELRLPFISEKGWNYQPSYPIISFGIKK